MDFTYSSAIDELQLLMKRLSESCAECYITQLKDTIRSMPPDVLKKFHAFILVPLFGEMIDSRHGVDVKHQLIQSAHLVLDRVHLSDISILKNLLNILMMQLFDKKSSNMIRAVPEEMKLSTLQCTLAIIDKMTPDVKTEFYTKSNIPIICQISYTCVYVAESEKYRALRICAMEVILALLQAPRKGTENTDLQTRKMIGDIFQFILPGASAKLSTIIAGDITQGSQVILTAVYTLSSMIASVMEDYETVDVEEDFLQIFQSLLSRSKDMQNREDEPETSEVHFSKDKSGMMQLINSSVGRSASWRKKVGQHLVSSLEKIAVLASHSNPKVCREVANSCGLLLLRCPKSLKEGSSSLLDALILLSMHEDVDVRKESQTALCQLKESFSTSSGHSFLELVEENLYMLLTRLPRLVQEEGGSKGASALALISGYMQLLGPSVIKVLSSAAHLQRFTLSLLCSLMLDCSGVPVAQEHTVRQLTPVRLEDSNLPWVRLSACNSAAALSNVQSLFSNLADPTSEALQLVAPQFLDALSGVPRFFKESILALNLILVSRAHHPDNYLKELALTVLDIYLDPEVWMLQERLSAVTSVGQLQSDIAAACLLAEGVGCCTCVLGAERTRPHLLRILYPLLERAGAANAALSLAGRRGLTHVCVSCGYGTDLMALLADNMDYVAHSMMTRLRHSDTQYGVFDALSMILQHTSPSIVSGLHSIVHSVLHHSESDIKSKDAYFRVFLTFARGVNVWLSHDLVHQDSSKKELLRTIHMLQDDAVEEDKFPSIGFSSAPVKWNAVQRLKEYLESFDIIQSDLDGDDESSANSIEEQHHDFASEARDELNLNPGENGEEKDVPELAKILISVLNRCIHCLSDSSVNLQFLALETLQAGLCALEPYTDTLFPIVHKIWSPLTGKFQASQPPLIIRASFRLLLTMACTARDFLLKRTVSEVIPQFNTFLKNHKDLSHLKSQGSAYRFSQTYKTQLALLQGLGPLTKHMQFRGQDFYSILTATLPYLSCYQPLPFQAACRTLVQTLMELDADATWWALVTWWTPPSLAIQLQLPETSHQDCKENVAFLLQIANGDLNQQSIAS